MHSGSGAFSLTFHNLFTPISNMYAYLVKMKGQNELELILMLDIENYYTSSVKRPGFFMSPGNLTL